MPGDRLAHPSRLPLKVALRATQAPGSVFESRLGEVFTFGIDLPEWGRLADRPQLKRAPPTLSGALVPVLRAGRACLRGRVWLAAPAGVGLGDVEAEGFEFGDELAQATASPDQPSLAAFCPPNRPPE